MRCYGLVLSFDLSQQVLPEGPRRWAPFPAVALKVTLVVTVLIACPTTRCSGFVERVGHSAIFALPLSHQLLWVNSEVLSIEAEVFFVEGLKRLMQAGLLGGLLLGGHDSQTVFLRAIDWTSVGLLETLLETSHCLNDFTQFFLSHKMLHRLDSVQLFILTHVSWL